MKKIFTSLAILLFFCCNEKNSGIQESEYVIKVNTDETEILDYSKKTSFNKFISLETTENSLIKKIEKIYFSKSIIIIFDESVREIFLFDHDGLYIGKCGEKGNGPGEHTYFSDVYYDEPTEQIYAYEGAKRSMYIYNLAGKLVDVIPTPNIQFRSFCKVEDGYWLYTGMQNKKFTNSLLKVDNSFNIIGGFIPQKVFFTTYWRSTFFQNEKGNIFFISPYGNIIYQIEKNELKPYFKIDFGKNSPPFDILNKLTDENEYNRLTTGDEIYGNIHNFILYKDIFYFNFSSTVNNSQIFFGHFDKTNNKSIVFNSFSEYKKDNFPFNGISFVQPLTIYKDNYICLVNPYHVSEESLNIMNKTSPFTITDDSNPLLFFLKITD